MNSLAEHLNAFEETHAQECADWHEDEYRSLVTQNKEIRRNVASQDVFTRPIQPEHIVVGGDAVRTILFMNNTSFSYSPNDMPERSTAALESWTLYDSKLVRFSKKGEWHGFAHGGMVDELYDQLVGRNGLLGHRLQRRTENIANSIELQDACVRVDVVDTEGMPITDDFLSRVRTLSDGRNKQVKTAYINGATKFAPKDLSKTDILKNAKHLAKHSAAKKIAELHLAEDGEYNKETNPFQWKCAVNLTSFLLPESVVPEPDEASVECIRRDIIHHSLGKLLSNTELVQSALTALGEGTDVVPSKPQNTIPDADYWLRVHGKIK
jgi:hypothetical protein